MEITAAIVVAPETSLTSPAWRTPPPGTWVKMTSFDGFGFCGREYHPREEDVGFFGRIVKTSLSTCDDEGCLVSHDEDAPAGTLVTGEYSYACYTVRAPSGRLLQLMNHEVEFMDVGAVVVEARRRREAK